MATPYSQDLRDRVPAAYDCGMPTKRIAEPFVVSRAWARRLKQRRRETGQTGPRPMGGLTLVKVDRARLAELAREHPDATLKEFLAMLGVECAESTICVALKKLGFTNNKRRSTRPSRTAPMSPRSDRAGEPISPGSNRSSSSSPCEMTSRLTSNPIRSHASAKRAAERGSTHWATGTSKARATTPIARSTIPRTTPCFDSGSVSRSNRPAG